MDSNYQPDTTNNHNGASYRLAVGNWRGEEDDEHCDSSSDAVHQPWEAPAADGPCDSSGDGDDSDFDATLILGGIGRAESDVEEEEDDRPVARGAYLDPFIMEDMEMDAFDELEMVQILEDAIIFD